MTNISMEVKTTTKKNNVEIKVTREAKLRAKELSFEAIAEFMVEVSKINALLKSAIKKNIFVEFEVCNYDDSFKTGTFDRWYFSGYPQDDNCELDNGVIGYYLRPDTKYTPEHHDMIYDYTLASITDASAVSRRG